MNTSFLQFRSFRARLLVFVLGLLLVVQAAGFLLVNTANTRNALIQVGEALEVTASVCDQSISDRNQRLLEKARLLSGDFAFKQAFATREHRTILSALENHQQRIGANMMMLISMEGQVIADTLHPELTATVFGLPSLLEDAAASEYGEASSVEFIDDQPFQLVAVPLYTPEPSAWIIIGFAIGDLFAQDLQATTRSQVSLMHRDGADSWSVMASTLPATDRAALARTAGRLAVDGDDGTVLAMNGRDYVSLVTPLSGRSAEPTVIVLQRNLRDALQPHLRLRMVLVVLFLGGVVLSIIGALMIARTVTRPVLALAEGARSVEEGDYAHTVLVEQQDELGALAGTFNRMTRGLEERDQVRNLLGKVVSPAIAARLMESGVELGGEEREVTILFSDVRKFTDLCENRSPTQILSLLNRYLTRISTVIEQHGGVVDKYVGDAVMALYGAPVAGDDDAERAVVTALQMQRALRELNTEFAREGLPPLGIGAGINTAVVVAGNMGSRSRLNYTVIGDGVNLASRLEALTKRYGVGTIVSNSTRSKTAGIVYRQLDTVCVKGRKEPVEIFEPVGLAGEVDAHRLEELAGYARALEAYRSRQWDLAHARFDGLEERYPDSCLYKLYLERVSGFLRNPPPDDWNGVTVYEEK